MFCEVAPGIGVGVNPSRAIATLLLLLTLAAACATPLEREQEAAAVPFAESWVRSLDAGDGEWLWEGTSEVRKMRIERDIQLKHWLGTREALGKLVSRRVELSWSLDPDFIDSVPDGTYWEVSFQCEFEHKRQVFQKLLLRWEDGRWRVVALDVD